MQAPGYTTTPSVAATGMMTEALPPAVHAEHVAGALRRSGALGDGRVRDVVVESSRATIVSQIIRLRLFYDGAAATHPGRLFSRPACLIAPVASGMRVARKPVLHVGCRRNGGTSLPAPL